MKYIRKELILTLILYTNEGIVFQLFNGEKLIEAKKIIKQISFGTKV